MGDYIIFAQIKIIFVVDRVFWLIQRKVSIEKLQLYLFSRSKISLAPALVSKAEVNSNSPLSTWKGLLNVEKLS